MGKALIVSIKPEFAERIFDGTKSIELRKCSPDVLPGDMIIIYCTNPVKAVLGVCEVERILKLKPSVMWKNYGFSLGIDKKRYTAYFENSQLAVGIVLTKVCKLDKNISLSTIKAVLPFFHPPQTFRYYNKAKLFKSYLKYESSINK